MKNANKIIWIFFLSLFLLSCSGLQNKSSETLSGNNEKSIFDLGVEVVALRLSAGGNMLDFRYLAVNPEKAQALFNRDTKPYLVHEATGKVVTVPVPPKIGPLRQTTNKPIAGKQYFMIFGNPGRFIKRGDRVTLVFDEHRIEGLVVE